MTELEVNSCSVWYGSYKALDCIHIQIEKNKTLGLVGESGSGKSTLARTIAGLIIPQTGEIVLESQKLAERRTREQHRKIQMVFQNPDSSLNPKLTVRQILSEPMLFHKIVTRGNVESRCRELLACVQLDSSALDAYPRAFSGGQRQRIALARALSIKPDVLIADEPTSALDVSVQLSILDLLKSIKKDLGLTMLCISHDLGVIYAVCDSVAVMKQGRIVETNTAETFFRHPETEYSRLLLSSVPRMETV